MQRIALGDGIGEIVPGLDHRGAGLIEPGVGVSRAGRGVRRAVRNDVRILPGQIRPALFGGAQLIAIGGDLLVEKVLRAVHLVAAAAGGFFGEDRQQRLHHVLGHLRIAIPVGDGHQVRGDWPHLDALGQPLVERVLLLGSGQLRVEIGQVDELLEIGPAEQGALQKIEMTRRVGIGRQAVQQRGQQRIDIEIDARGRFVFGRDKGDRDPADRAHQPGDADGEPLLPPQRQHDRHGLRLDRIHRRLHSGKRDPTIPGISTRFISTGGTSTVFSRSTAVAPLAANSAMVRTGAAE